MAQAPKSLICFRWLAKKFNKNGLGLDKWLLTVIFQRQVKKQRLVTPLKFNIESANSHF